MCRGIIIVLALVGAAYGQEINPTDNYHAIQNGAPQSQQKPSSGAPPGLPIAVQNNVERIARALETANNKQEAADEKRRAEQYLRDQDQLATLGWYMFGAALVELALTGAGIWLLWNTLRATRANIGETKRAADEAKRQADIAQASFESVETPRVYPTELRYFSESTPLRIPRPGSGSGPFIGTHPGLSCATKFRNYGRAPAKMISATLRVFIVDPADHGIRHFAKSRTVQFNFMLGEKDTSSEFKIGPLPEAMRFNDGIGRGDVCLTLLVNMEYTDINGKEASIGISYYWDAPANEFVFGSPPIDQRPDRNTEE